MPIYVAEINIPIACHMSIDARCEIENSAYFGINRGYWKIALRPDEIGNDKPSGVDIVLELTAGSIERAEDAVLDAGKSLSLFFSVIAGQPSTSPRLQRLAEIGPSRGIIEQREYYYENNGTDLTPMEMTPWKFASFLRRVTQKSPRTRQSLEMAIRWYSIGLTANDPLDSYLAIWIGLEALSEPTAERYHPKGHVRCQLCGQALRIIKENLGKRKGNKKDEASLLAINHLIKKVAHELLETKSIIDLRNYRNFVAHPDRFIRKERGLDEVRGEIRPFLQDIQLCLAVGILNLVNPPKEDPGTVTLWATPRVEPHPYSMARVRSLLELNSFDPWIGKWIKVEPRIKTLSSRIEKSGLYFAKMESEIPISIESRGPKPNIVKEYVVFKQGLSIGDYGDPPLHREWRPVKVSPAWKRMMAEKS